jgi:hypothetical protein
MGGVPGAGGSPGPIAPIRGSPPGPTPGGIRTFVMADTALPPGSPYRDDGRGFRRTGRKIMVGIEFVGWGLLTVAFTAIQYSCLLISAGKA